VRVTKVGVYTGVGGRLDLGDSRRCSGENSDRGRGKEDFHYFYSTLELRHFPRLLSVGVKRGGGRSVRRPRGDSVATVASSPHLPWRAPVPEGRLVKSGYPRSMNAEDAEGRAASPAATAVSWIPVFASPRDRRQ